MSNGTYVSTGPVEVLKALQDGEKFIKWDEVSIEDLLIFFHMDSISQSIREADFRGFTVSC